jgi:hypothetical protein
MTAKREQAAEALRRFASAQRESRSEADPPSWALGEPSRRREQLELLSTFDRLTGSRLAYLVNGPSNLDRVLDLYATVSVDRVHITNSRAIARDSAPGTSFTDKETSARLCRRPSASRERLTARLSLRLIRSRPKLERERERESPPLQILQGRAIRSDHDQG